MVKLRSCLENKKWDADLHRFGLIYADLIYNISENPLNPRIERPISYIFFQCRLFKQLLNSTLSILLEHFEN